MNRFLILSVCVALASCESPRAAFSHADTCYLHCDRDAPKLAVTMDRSDIFWGRQGRYDGRVTK